MKSMMDILGSPVELQQAHDEAQAITYLLEKFPDVDKDVFFTDRYGKRHAHVQEIAAVCQADNNERACAACDGRTCKVKSRPILRVDKGFLDVRWACEATCKFRPFKRSLVKKSRLYPNQLDKTFEAFDAGGNKELEKAKACAMLADNHHTPLILGGLMGVGKTHLATAIMLEAMRNDEQAIFWTVNDLLSELERLRFDGGAADLIAELKSVPCLVLDDFGRRVPTEPYGSQLYQIVEARCMTERQTIVTTNMTSPTDLREIPWAASMLSRLLEYGTWVTIKNAEDFRLKRGVARWKAI